MLIKIFVFFIKKIDFIPDGNYKRGLPCPSLKKLNSASSLPTTHSVQLLACYFSPLLSGILYMYFFFFPVSIRTEAPGG